MSCLCLLVCDPFLQQKFKGMQQMAPQLTKVQMKLPQTKREALATAKVAADCAALTAAAIGDAVKLTHSGDSSLCLLQSNFIVHHHWAASMCAKRGEVVLQLRVWMRAGDLRMTAGKHPKVASQPPPSGWHAVLRSAGCCGLHSAKTGLWCLPRPSCISVCQA
jgi:hypothetical protein